MLSFQKEEQNQNPTVHQIDDEQQATAPDSDTPQEDYLTVSSRVKSLRQSTMILIVLFAVGGLGVWFMIKKTVPASANAAPSQDQAQLDAALAQLNSVQTEVTSQMDSVVGRFHRFSDVDQVGVDELKKNPFAREFAEVEQEVEAEKKAEDEFKIRENKARQKVLALELWSITSTSKGRCCMVDNKLLYEGDSISGMLLKTIKTKSVIFECDGIPVELKMSE